MPHEVFIRHTYIYTCSSCNREWKINEASDIERLNCPHCGKEKDDTIVDNAVDKIATKATIKSGSKVATNIAPKVGHKVAAKILSKIGGKFIPGVGTALIAKDIYDFSKAASKATVKELNENAASSSIYFGGRKI